MFPLMIKYVQKKYLGGNICGKRRNHLYYQYKYNPIIELILNRQIHEEQQAAQEYLNMAVTFLHPSTCLIGVGGFFMKMYHEELKHMLELIHYQLFRGGRPLICGLIPPVEYKNLTVLDAMKKSLEMEKLITKLIEDFIKMTEELEDYQAADFLTTVFLNEQMKSINEIAQHVTKMTLLKNCKDGVYHYDLKLAKRYPYCYIPKNLGNTA